ncbi:hypothetical protein [Pseudomonas chlororaphis]|jgi:hypothetical protein|uniref:hypothetical protein n=1 Tax=Pseudomonas chlororaphis TaxID=587753 RepID=UPI000E0C1AEA|nr:hypothetical protein [Pseudomonas chlororaphis]AZD14093.1 hypothetical protein C4K25_1145 [Pseudomonas chlororaphis]WDG57154.1 hypothetical protein PUP76_04710 [Pseudomonas chlororaphis]WDH50194.1 hypothetical protein PUP66_06840 [Pseudomonas chlororaphis]WDH54483.1 hypothetical protein PUP75_06740 [Pseudomonas chlororaphis]WDH60432.1 hypothetical protein PUP56_06840 [Pseudomonas chlororaphis]
MRIDGISSQSYPIKRKPRKGNVLLDDSLEDADAVEVQPETSAQARSQASAGRTSNLPARPQDMIFHRAMKRSVANALASYLTTAGFVDWDMEVVGLDLHI